MAWAGVVELFEYEVGIYYVGTGKSLRVVYCCCRMQRGGARTRKEEECGILDDCLINDEPCSLLLSEIRA